MYDRRYPFMAPLDRADVPRDTRAMAREVASRTYTNCFVNTIKKTLLFCYGNEPGGGPLVVKFHQCRTGADADDMVRYINLGKMRRRDKDRIAVSSELMEQHEREEANGRLLADRRRDALNYAGFLDRRRRGTQTVVVPV